jgi:hypothetical protein
MPQWVLELLEVHSKRRKKINRRKKKTSIQFLDLNAQTRLDEDFLSYCADNDDCEDDHVAGVEDVSPFFYFFFPVVTGFIIDPITRLLREHLKDVLLVLHP